MICASEQVKVRDLVAGYMDIAGGSPRRYFFEVARHFAAAEHEGERLEYFASPVDPPALERVRGRGRRRVCLTRERGARSFRAQPERGARNRKHPAATVGLCRLAAHHGRDGVHDSGFFRRRARMTSTPTTRRNTVQSWR